MTAAPSFAWRTLGLVALGGAAGAGLRAALLWPGVLGGFTTFSAFALQLATSTPWAAVLLALATMVLGVLAAGAGLRLGRALAHRGGGTDAPELAE